MKLGDKFAFRVVGNLDKTSNLVDCLSHEGYICNNWEWLVGKWNPNIFNFIYFTKKGEKDFDLGYGEFGNLVGEDRTFDTSEEVLNFLNIKAEQISADTILYMECEDLAEVEAVSAYVKGRDEKISGTVHSPEWSVISFNFPFDETFFILGRTSQNHRDLLKRGVKYNFSQLKQFVQDAKKILELKSKKEIQLKNSARVELMEDGIIQIGCKEYSVKTISLLIDLLKYVGFKKLELHDLTFEPSDAKEIEKLIKTNS